MSAWTILLLITVAALTCYVVVFCFLNRRELRTALEENLELKEQNKALLRVNDESMRNFAEDAVRNERVRIADSLHDQTLGNLSSVHLHFDKYLTDGEFSELCKVQLERSRDLIKHTYEEVRDMVTKLKHQKITESSHEFLVQLEELVQLITKPLNIDCRFHLDKVSHLPDLSFEFQMEIYRLLKECINNVVKHAAATEITVEVLGVEDRMTFVVTDNGVGFDPMAVKLNGLQRMEERVKELTGRMSISKALPSGTRVSFSLPNHT